MSVIGKIKVGGTIYDIAYPVGSIYMSVNSTSPAELFGGTWEQIKDTFLLACGNNYTAGSTGGEAQHTLTVNEMPSHTHTIENGTIEVSGDSKGNVTYANNNSILYSATNTTVYAKGGSQPHNNMPPYLCVYMWKRTA